MARSADVRADESADMFNGLLRLRQNCREQLPHVDHLRPDLQAHLYPTTLCPLDQPLGVVEQYLGLANLNEQRGQPCEIGIERRSEWRPPVTVAEIEPCVVQKPSR